MHVERKVPRADFGRKDGQTRRFGRVKSEKCAEKAQFMVLVEIVSMVYG